MNITDVPFAVLRFQYELARFPLQMIEERVLPLIDPEAPARLFFERSLGMLDVTAGTALRVPELKQRGAALIERSDELRRAARLDRAATENIEQAGSNLRATREKAAKDQQDARAKRQSEVAEAHQEAQDRKRAAVDDAEKRIAMSKTQADEAATQRTSVVEAAKREEHAMIRTAEQTATAAADAQRRDAGEKRAEAADKRAQADVIEEAADVEKERRQAGSADNG